MFKTIESNLIKIAGWESFNLFCWFVMILTAFKNAPKWQILKFKSESRPIYAWEKRISGLKQAKIKKSVANSNLNGPWMSIICILDHKTLRSGPDRVSGGINGYFKLTSTLIALFYSVYLVVCNYLDVISALGPHNEHRLGKKRVFATFWAIWDPHFNFSYAFRMWCFSEVPTCH